MKTFFQCGTDPNHLCNTDGPNVCGGFDDDGNGWVKLDVPENRKGATWGSTSCSICGMAVLEFVSQWRDYRFDVQTSN